jgi:tRNA 2-thiouridine synthesizing protein D
MLARPAAPGPAPLLGNLACLFPPTSAGMGADGFFIRVAGVSCRLFRNGAPMKFVIALFAPPHSPAARRALRFAEAALAGGHEISRLFFYQDGVHSASANVVAAQDELDVAAQWNRFVTANQLDGVVCIAAGLRRGVLDAGEAQRYQRPAANLAAGWELSGLGQLHEAAQQADRLVCFGGQ